MLFTMDCGVCLTKIKQNESSIKCSGICKAIFHGKCIDMKASHCKLVEECTSLKWYCDKCLPLIDFFNEIRSEITEFKKEIKSKIISLQDSIKSKSGEEGCETAAKSYANVTKEVVVIKPKNKQESKETKKSVQEIINPADLNIGISEIRNIQEGGVIIKCDSKEEAEKIKTVANEKLSENYNINSPKLKNPCIKILDIDIKLSNDDLIKSIKNQNCYLNDDNVTLKVITIKKMIKNYMAIVECDPKTYFKILGEGKLFLNWSKCRIFEHIHIFRCYRCGGYNHGANKCSEKVDRCLKCSKKGHRKEDCTSEEFKCVNCVDVNLKSQLSLDVSHSCFDSNCTILQKKLEFERQKICYTSSDK